MTPYELKVETAQVTGSLLHYLYSSSCDGTDSLFIWKGRIGRQITVAAPKAIPFAMAAGKGSDGTGIMATCHFSDILGGVLGQFPPPAKYTMPMPADFPYRGEKESQWPLCNGIPRQIHDQQQKMGPRDVLVKCRVSGCNVCIKISAMRLHVATHILRRQYGTASSLLPSPDDAWNFVD